MILSYNYFFGRSIGFTGFSFLAYFASRLVTGSFRFHPDIYSGYLIFLTIKVVDLNGNFIKILAGHIF